MTTKSALLIAVSGVALTMATAAPALAQSAPATSVGEIVVTAQKRAQNLQAVPLSVSAVTQELLKTNRIENLLDLNAIVPNLTIRQSSWGSNLPDTTMRGLNSDNAAIGGESEVGFYIDGVYQGAAAGSVFDLPDVERIEVARGPQGSLFGQNATAGDISIFTPDPKGHFDLQQTFGGGNYDQFLSKTILDLPSWGPFSMRIAYEHYQRQGDIRNLGAGTVWNFPAPIGRQVSPEWLGNENENIVQAAVKFAPTNNFTMTYKFWYSEDNGSPEGNGYFAVLPEYGIDFPGLLASQYQALMTKQSTERPNAVNNWYSSINEFHNMGSVVTTTWRVTHDFTVKETLGQITSDLMTANNLDGVGGVVITPQYYYLGYTAAGVKYASVGAPYPFFYNDTGGHTREFSNELQLNYDSHWITLTTGGLYYDFAGSQGGLPGSANTIDFEALPNFTIPSDPGSSLSFVRTRSQAVYGQAEVHVTPQLDADIGGRWTWDEKDSTATVPGLPSYGIYSDSLPTWTANLNYKVTRDFMVYVKYATSFMAGGTQSVWDWKPEKAASYEAGVKSEWFDHCLRANLTVYTATYDELQLIEGGASLAAAFNNPNLDKISATFANVGDEKAQGFEFESTLVPVERLTLGATLGYTDAHYFNILSAFAVPALQVEYTPKWTAGLSMHYDTKPVYQDAYVSFSINGDYRSGQFIMSQFYSPAEHQLADEPGTWLVNTRLSLTNLMFDGHKGEVSLWAKNLTDDRSEVFGLTVPWIGSAVYQRARTFGLDVTFTY